MERYFPADVSLRVEGDLGAAQQMFGAASQLLYKALRMQSLGGNVPVKLFQPGVDGSLIYVFLHRGLKQVYVQTAPVVRKPEEPLLVDVPVAVACPDMLSGVVNPGTASEVGAISKFHPTQVCADTHNLKFEWQDSARLAISGDKGVDASEPLQVHWPKPSMYSGAMKRVVQALYGMGRTDYVNDSGNPDLYETRNHYHYKWAETDGIVRVGDSFWIVRINISGVIAMPLMLFLCTATTAFKSLLTNVGDTDTLAIINEFGGLPSGESFPDALDAAIADGRVLRLMDADAIKPFFRDGIIDKYGLHDGCGWAFCESGKILEAHNTSFWYSNKVAAQFSPFDSHGNPVAYPYADLPLEDRMLRAEHWKISIELSVANAQVRPVGVGSATLAMVSSGLMIGDALYVSDIRTDLPFAQVPTGGRGEGMRAFEYWGREGDSEESYYGRLAMLDHNCPVLVFYNGDDLEVVRHQREKTYFGDPVRGPLIVSNGSHPLVDRSALDMAEHRYLGTYTLYATMYFGTLFDAQWAVVWQDYYNGLRFVAIEEGSGAVQPIHNYTFKDALLTQFEYYQPSGRTIITQLPVPLDAYGATKDWPYEASYTVNYYPGIHRSGRFYGTTVDLREERRQHSVRSASLSLVAQHAPTIIDYADAWESEIGLVVPPMCREGYLLANYFGGYTSPANNSTRTKLATGIRQKGFFPGLGSGSIDFETLPEAEGDIWPTVWLSMLRYNFSFGASINAGPTKCGVTTDGVYRNFYTGLPLLRESYLGTANGIDVTDATAKDTTYVGAV